MLAGCVGNHAALKNGTSGLSSGQKASSINSAQTSEDDIPTASSFYSKLKMEVTEPSVTQEFYGGVFKLTKVYVKADVGGSFAKGDALLGVAGADGKTIAECVYRNVRVLSRNRVYVEFDYGSRARIYDNKGNIISNNQYHRIDYWTDPKTGKLFPVGIGTEIYPADVNKSNCLVDFDGKKVIPTNFVRMRINNDPKTISVDDGEKQYVIDLTGKLVTGVAADWS